MTYEKIDPPPRRRSSASGTVADGQHGHYATAQPEDKVGYGNPPKQHRWKKGVSGNPKGKAPGTKSFNTLIEQELDVLLEVTERGKKRKYTKRRVAAMRVVNKAVEGDDKSLTFLLRREGNIAVVPSTAPASEEPLLPDEQSILDHFMDAARIAVEREHHERGT